MSRQLPTSFAEESGDCYGVGVKSSVAHQTTSRAGGLLMESGEVLKEREAVSRARLEDHQPDDEYEADELEPRDHEHAAEKLTSRD